uniref:Sodium:dicarboxylate symporter n=1 Tax=uncultured Bacteroidota bacterium TaxID=152509 RepID=H5SNW6_9BACT|nr:sodium:dicarboxylate symporter [uncultured Bacteroidetes bacterium]
MDKEKKLSLRLLAGFGVGVAGALLARKGILPPEATLAAARIMGELFLRGIFMLILPLVVPMLLLGMQRLGSTGALGKVGRATLASVLGLTAISALLGMTLTAVFQPGTLLSPSLRTQLTEKFGQAPPARPLTSDFLLNLLPKNPFHEVATAFTPAQEGGLLSIVVFTILLGIALLHLSEDLTRPFYQVLDTLYQASLWLLLKILYWLGPIGIAGLIFQAVLGLGWEIFRILGAYAGVVLLGLLLQGAGVYSLFLRFFAGISPLRILRSSTPALLMAFSSASSNATLPTTLKVAIDRLGIAPPIAQFIITLGATVNQNGTALYEGVTLLFLAQVFGVDLPFGTQVLILALAMLIAIGAAGVPGGSLPLLAGVLPLVGIPPAAIALIYGIDRFLDMCRTTMNVYGDLVISTYVNKIYNGNPKNS